MDNLNIQAAGSKRTAEGESKMGYGTLPHAAEHKADREYRRRLHYARWKHYFDLQDFIQSETWFSSELLNKFVINAIECANLFDIDIWPEDVEDARRHNTPEIVDDQLYIDLPNAHFKKFREKDKQPFFLELFKTLLRNGVQIQDEELPNSRNRENRRIALAMALHQRLGRDSPFGNMESSILRNLLISDPLPRPPSTS